MRQDGEPSVEEILESIKKVIARDNRASAADQRKQRESRGIAVSEPADNDQTDDILDLDEAAEFIEETAGSEVEVPLLGAGPRASMRESLAALAMLSEPGAQPQIVRSGETSLEGLTRELLRPVLAQWLDTNLPPLVEKLVATEIARIVGKKG